MKSIQDELYRDVQKIIGANLKRLRNERGMSGATLAAYAGVSPMLISNLERGAIKTTTGHACEALANAFEMSVDELIRELTKGAYIANPNNKCDVYCMDLANMYPYNLVIAVAGEKDLYRVSLPGVQEALTTLSDREKTVLEDRYREGQTLETVGRSLGVTRERVRQIEAKALRKLRHSSRIKLMFFPEREAFEEAARMVAELKEINERLVRLIPNGAVEKERLRDIPIERLELSVRSYNCLKRARIRTAAEVANMSDFEIIRIRNLGKKSIQEIYTKLREFGFEPNFSTYITA